jgi:hypothetical protein
MTRSALVLLAAVSLATPAGAVESKPALVPQQQIVSDFAACVLRQEPEATKALLASEAGSDQERVLARRLMEGTANCARGRPFISMMTGEARGALAEAALKADAGLARSAEALTVIASDRPTATEGRPFVIAYGRCLTGRDPARARALTDTVYGSDEERQAVLAFGDALKDCMPIGVNYQLNIRDVRNHVASALYDRALAASGGGDKNA